MTIAEWERQQLATGAAMNVKDLVAIDVHTHAEVSCRHEPDEVWKTFEDASAKYFKAGKRPTIAETIAYYRERKIGLVMFTVDSEFEIGARRIPNEEVADAARENSDIMMAFASIDPHKGKMGVREARRLLEGRRDPRLQVPPDAAGFLPQRPHRLSTLRSDRGAQAAGDLPQRPFGHGHRHAGRRRTAAQVLQSDPSRRRRGGLSRT